MHSDSLSDSAMLAGRRSAQVGLPTLHVALVSMSAATWKVIREAVGDVCHPS